MYRSSSDVVLLASSSTSLNYQLYRRRFYVLFIFAYLAFNQCLFWLTFSPISQSAQKYYHISESTINLLLNWGPIIFIPFLPVTYLLLNKRHGLRKSVLLLAVTCFLATLVRVLPLVLISSESPNFPSISLFCIHLGQILNAACGPLVMAPVSQLSCLWFGPDERTRATTSAIMACSLGSTVGFLISPWIVDSPEHLPNLLYVHLALAFIACLMTLLYFPAEPPTPPSLAAQLVLEHTIDEHNASSLSVYVKDLRQCFTTPSFIYLCSIGGLLGGAFAAWTSLFANILALENFTERQSGWLGFSASLASIVGGLCSSVLADTHHFRHSFKLIIVSTLICCFCSLLWFQLSVHTIFSDQPILTPTLFSIAVSVTLAGFFQGSASPLIYEALAETMFPLPESLSASVLVQLNNITALILIFIPPDLYKLMNLLVTLSVGACILMGSMMQINYKRRNEEERKQ